MSSKTALPKDSIPTAGAVTNGQARLIQRTAQRRFRWRGDWSIALVLFILGFLTFIPLIMLLELSLKSQQQMADAMWLPAWPLYFKNYRSKKST